MAGPKFNQPGHGPKKGAKISEVDVNLLLRLQLWPQDRACGSSCDCGRTLGVPRGVPEAEPKRGRFRGSSMAGPKFSPPEFGPKEGAEGSGSGDMFLLWPRLSLRSRWQR